MPRKKGRKIKGGLGSSLVKSKNRRKVKRKEYIEKNKSEQVDLRNGKQKLESVLEMDSVADFLYQAELSQKTFDAQKNRRMLVYKGDDPDEHQVIIDLNKNSIFEKDPESVAKANNEIKRLKVPRKPKWDGIRTSEEQTLIENKAFHEWRMSLAAVEDKYRFTKITPYEKNIEMWRQLWRVVEKSDILVQIVDGRDPFFFRCEDFNKYVEEVDNTKMNILLINKADLLKEEVRKRWNDYLNKQKVDHVFFSAKQQQIEIDSDLKIDEEEDYLKFKNSYEIVNRGGLKKMLKSLVEQYRSRKLEKVITELPEEEDKEETEEKEIVEDKEKPEIQANQEEEEKKEEEETEEKEIVEDEEPETQADQEEGMVEITPKGEETEEIDEEKLKQGQIIVEKVKARKNQDMVTIGMVGFPNVGKSSVINVLCGKKLVGVASRPGKTRNFQTILLEKNLMLCDCPGLVFPSIVASRAQMVCNGVYPIDNMREYMEPIDYLTERIPRKVFEFIFKFSASSEDEFIEAGRLLHCYANSRGYVKAGSGLPDYHKAARIILKALVNGELVYCALPEGEEDKQPFQYNDIPEDFLAKTQLQNPKDNKGKVYKSSKEQMEELNSNFFQEEEEIFDVTQLDQDDIIKLVTGKRVYGFKLNKTQRRELKWSIKRDDDAETIFKMVDLFLNRGKKKMVHIKKRESDQADI